MNKKARTAQTLAAMDATLDNSERRHQGFPRQLAGTVRLVKQLHKLLNDQANALLRPHGLTHAEYMVLIMLDGSPTGLAPSELAEACSEKPANTTRLVDHLVSKGLVTRQASPSDRRSFLIQLTDAGSQRIDQLLPEISTQLQSFFVTLAPQEVHTFDHLLKQVIGAIEG